MILASATRLHDLFQKVLTRAELVQAFTLERITGKSAVFDVQKLEWLNGQHLARLPGHAIAARAIPWLADAGVATGEELEARRPWLDDLMRLVSARSRTLRDLVDQARPFFPGPIAYQPDAVDKFWKDRGEARRALETMAAFLATVDGFDDLAGTEERLRAFADEKGVPAGKLMQATRVAITGARVSPGIFETMAAMGKPLVLERLAAAIEHLA